ncbi:MAG: hypothetical protein JXL84_03465 [Deltaproteobacteria bacterium]|nr:hypothetical protein [Deltaproteobacteria bacterium]
MVIGSPGTDSSNPRYDSSERQIVIGSSNIIREFTAIQKPLSEELTSIGSNVHLMPSVQIAHDAVIYDHVAISAMVAAGLVKVLQGATISQGAAVHQHTVIGHYSIVGMGASVLNNTRPFSR